MSVKNKTFLKMQLNIRAVDTQSTDGYCTFLWCCQASTITGVAYLLTEMATMLLH